jgi:putative endonuclease
MKKTNDSTRKKGAQAEELAADFLRQNGYTVIKRNYTVRGGELDIIACNGDFVVFAEVKSRKNKDFGAAGEAVGKAKISHMINCAERFLFENRESPLVSGKSIRFDVIEVYTQSGELCHIKNIDIN